MTEMNDSKGFSGASVQKYPFLKVPPSDTSREAEDFQNKVAEEIAKMRSNELAVDRSQDCDDVDHHDHRIREADNSQLLTVEPPLTLSKICSKLTAIEQLWLARMVTAHGKELVLARWPSYEIHINLVRYLL